MPSARRGKPGQRGEVTLELAERLDDTGYRLKALWGLWVDRLNNGQLDMASDLARRFAAIATQSSNAVDLTMADRMLATTLHFLGDQQPARQHIEAGPAVTQPRPGSGSARAFNSISR